MMTTTTIYYTTADGTKGSVTYPYELEQTVEAFQQQMRADGEDGYTIRGFATDPKGQLR